MTNKNKNKKNKNKARVGLKKNTPFRDVGTIIGSSAGNMFGLPFLKNLGRFLGSGIGSIFGSGDYQLSGPAPTYNVLLNSSQVPQFSTSKATNVIAHREYLGEINGTSGFQNRTFPLNPGVSTTFPWLATIAQNYQQYKFHGIIFEFKPLITDFVTSGAPGVVVMATNYNSDAPPYSTKQDMENSEYAVSVKPTCGLIHGIECDITQTVLPQLYVRTGAVSANQDLKTYDQGLFQFASQANPVQLLGELWVSYVVEFFKPVLPVDIGGNVLSAHIERASITGASPFGTVGVLNIGDLFTLVTSTSIIFPAMPSNYYLVQLYWTGSIQSVNVRPPNTYTFVNAAFSTQYNGANKATAPEGGAVTAARISDVFILKCTSLVPDSISITPDASGTFPTGTTNLTVIITQLSTEAIV